MSSQGPFTLFKVFLFTDIVGSTQIKSRLGDSEAARIFTVHDTVFRACLAENGGEERDHAGDGFFASFDRPSEAIRCALMFQSRLGSAGLPDEMCARIGIHMGEIVLVTEQGDGAGHQKYVGLAVDTAARVMNLAEGGRVLLSRAAFDAARPQVLTGPDGEPLQWLAHGSYQIKGLEDPVEICEVGLALQKKIDPPRDSDKARRIVSQADEMTLGWRPAPGIEIPHRPNWILESKLGEGGFGEVWLAIQNKSRARRVFKFCFQADRLRGLKREVVLFRVLRESLGNRHDIAQIIDWQFDEPPFFLEAEYSEGGSLLEWADGKGGIESIPLPIRMEIVAKIAEALAAAHSAGILHKDIKPSNILIVPEASSDVPTIRLTDFGIGMITDPIALDHRGITVMGLTKSTFGSTRDSTNSGTQLYMAPELFEGKPPTTLSDLYALGVLLYQMVCGDFQRAVAAGWERDIADELLREDIAACVDGRPEMRLQSAAELADRLVRLNARREERERERKAREEAVWAREYAASARRRRTIRLGIAAVAALAIVGLALGVAYNARIASEQTRLRLAAETAGLEAVQSRDAAEKARLLAEEREIVVRRFLYAADMNAAMEAWKSRDFDQLLGLLERQKPAQDQTDLRGFEWRFLWEQSHREDLKLAREFSVDGQTLVASAALSPDGSLAALGYFSGTRANQPSPIILWDTSTGLEKMRLEGHKGMIADIQFFPDGEKLATASPDKTIRIWNVADGKLIRELTGSEQWIIGLAISPDGQKIASGGGAFSFNRQAEFKIWDAATGKLLASPDLQGQIGCVFSIKFSADASKVLVGFHQLTEGTTYAGTARLYETAGGRELGVFGGADDDEALAVELSPDGRTAYCGGGERIIKAWDTETGSHVKTFSGFDGSISAIQLSGDARTMLVATGNWLTKNDPGEVQILDAQTGRRISRGRILEKGAWSMSASSDGRRLLFGMMNGKCNILDWVRDDAPPDIRLPGGACLASVSPDGRLLALAQGGIINADWRWDDTPEGASHTSMITLVDTKTMQQIRRIEAIPEDILDIAFSWDGELLAASTGRLGTYSGPGMICVWNARTGDKIREITGHSGAVFSLAFTPGGRGLVSTGADEVFRVWDVASGEQRAEHHPHKQWVSRVRFASMNEGKDVRLITASVPRHTALGQVGRSQSGAEVILWSWPEMKNLGEYPAMSGGVLDATISPDGRYLAAAGMSNYLILWDLFSKDSPPRRLEMRRANALTSIAFSSDGSTLMAGGLDAMTRRTGGELAFWDPPTAQMKGHLEFANGGISQIVTSPDGNSLILGFTDGAMRQLGGITPKN